MINAYDVLSRFEKQIFDSNNFCHDVVDQFINATDFISELIDNDSLTQVPMDSQLIQQGCDLVQYLDGKTITLKDGTIVPLHAIIDSGYYILEQNVSGQTNQFLCIVDSLRNEAVWRPIYGHDNLNLADLMDSCITTASCCDIYNTAISLAYNGQLNEQNFISAISDYAVTVNSDIKTVINSIRYGISGNDDTAQVTSLVNVLKQLFGGVQGATQDPDDPLKINFNDNTYTVSSSILFPVEDIITSALTMIGSLVAIVQPIFGLIIMGVSAAAAKAADIIEKNDDSHFSITNINSRDNDCFATPIIQNSMDIEELPQEIIEELSFKGVLKMVNGFSTIYLWYADVDHETVNIEVFMNANCYVKYNTPGESDYLFNSIMNTVIDIPNTSTTVANGTTAGLKTNIKYWLENLSTPGGDDTDYDILLRRYDYDVFDHELSNRFILSLALFAVLALRVGNVSGQFRKYVSPDEWRSGGNAEPDGDLQTILSFLSFLYTYRNEPNLFNRYYSMTYNMIAPAVNYVVPALRRLFSGSDYNDTSITFLLSFGLNNADLYSQSLQAVGKWSTYVTSYSIVNKVNPGVFPPKSTVSIWARIAFAAIVVTVVVVAALIAKTKIKRNFQFRAYNKQQQLLEMSKSLSSTSSQSDWNAYRKATRKYNRFLGRFSGTTFDMNNAWVNYQADTVETASTIGALTSVVSGKLTATSNDPVANSGITDVKQSLVGVSSSIGGVSGKVDTVGGDVSQLKTLISG